VSPVITNTFLFFNQPGLPAFSSTFNDAAFRLYSHPLAALSLPTAPLHSLGLFLHLLGLFLIAGGSVGGVAVEQMLWQRMRHQAVGQAIGLLPLLRLFPKFILIGSVLMPISGLMMLEQTNWVYWGHPWLIGKLVLYVLLVLNALLVAKPANDRLVQQIMQSPEKAGNAHSHYSPLHGLSPTRRRLNLYTVTQFLTQILLLALSSFKPV
jgi:hypothetical protein